MSVYTDPLRAYWYAALRLAAGCGRACDEAARLLARRLLVEARELRAYGGRAWMMLRRRGAVKRLAREGRGAGFYAANPAAAGRVDPVIHARVAALLYTASYRAVSAPRTAALLAYMLEHPFARAPEAARELGLRGSGFRDAASRLMRLGLLERWSVQAMEPSRHGQLLVLVADEAARLLPGGYLSRAAELLYRHPFAEYPGEAEKALGLASGRGRVCAGEAPARVLERLAEYGYLEPLGDGCYRPGRRWAGGGGV